MFMLVIQSLLLIALAYLIGCLLGCLLKRIFGSKPEPRYVPAAKPAAKTNMAPAAAAATAVAATAAVATKAPASKPKAAPKPKPKAAPKPKPKAKAKAKAKPVKLTAAQLKKEEAEANAKLAALPKGASAADKANAVGKKPRGLPSARAGGADDLKLIKGVGKVIEGKLNAEGIWHFNQISKWGRPEIQWFDAFLSFKGRIDRDEWIKQADILAKGGVTEFSKRAAKGEVASSAGGASKKKKK
ncbi:MAG: hypothetical protein ABJM86_00600 [Hyphomicrobiales bacterium]